MIRRGDYSPVGAMGKVAARFLGLPLPRHGTAQSQVDTAGRANAKRCCSGPTTVASCDAGRAQQFQIAFIDNGDGVFRAMRAHVALTLVGVTRLSRLLD